MKRFIYSAFWVVVLICVPLSFITKPHERFPYIVMEVPDRYNPWAKIDLKDKISPLTSYKLSKFKGDFPSCVDALQRAKIDFSEIQDQTVGSCTLTDRINMEQTRYPYSAPLRPTCPMAAALIVWEERVVQPAAEKHFDDQVASIQQLGIFSCRNIAGSSRRSQHAHANAIDIGGFQLKGGERISLLRDWDDTGPKGAFLRDIRDGSCDVFRGVLGPEYNAAHADHFHLDFGPYSICR